MPEGILLKKTLYMRPIKEILSEMKPLMGSQAPEDRKRYEELKNELAQRELTDEEKAIAAEWYRSGMNEIKEDIESLRQKIGDEYELLPLAYIAEKYFNKTRSWLYQRLNGYSVRGKVYTLNPSERETFNRAVQEIAQRISSVHV